MPTTTTPISLGSVPLDCPDQAARELAAQLQPNAACTLVLTSSRADHDALAGALSANFDHPVIGCTTSGEIGPAGYQSDSLTAFSFGSDAFQCLPLPIPDIHDLQASLADVVEGAEAFAKEAERDERVIGILLVDGLGLREEQVALELYTQALPFVMIGGSAGDDLEFRATKLFFDGRFQENAAVLLLLRTSLPFVPFKLQHHATESKSLVVTRAQPAQRKVQELNGRPAVQEYARLTGVEPEDLDPAHFSTHPVAVKRGGQEFLRAIRQANADGSLDLYCDIEKGAVLRLATAQSPVEKLTSGLEQVREQLGGTPATLTFDCILRRLEFERDQRSEEVGRILCGMNSVGFSTYGEQYNAMHVNQTLVGIAFLNEYQ